MFLRINDTLIALAEIRRVELSHGHVNSHGHDNPSALLILKDGSWLRFEEDAAEALRLFFNAADPKLVVNLDKMFKQAKEEETEAARTRTLTQISGTLVSPKECPVKDLHSEGPSPCPLCGYDKTHATAPSKPVVTSPAPNPPLTLPSGKKKLLSSLNDLNPSSQG